MKKTTVGPKIQENARNFYENHFRSTNAGVSYVLEAFPRLYETTMTRLKKLFNERELFAILDVVNGLMLTPSLAGSHLLADLEDATAFGLAEKWGIKAEALVDKIKSLGLPERAILEIWARAYWEKHGDKSPQQYIYLKT